MGSFRVLFLTAGVLPATGMRPIGGWLLDRISGARPLPRVSLAWPTMLPFTVGALGRAAFPGAGNGAVFKLVPQYFAAETGTVTGLVGAMGGLAGFSPPSLVGFFHDRLGMIWPALHPSPIRTALVDAPTTS
jgi:MFS transporter, NNP family, nitrate/nitrite transporter